MRLYRRAVTRVLETGLPACGAHCPTCTTDYVQKPHTRTTHRKPAPQSKEENPKGPGRAFPGRLIRRPLEKPLSIPELSSVAYLTIHRFFVLTGYQAKALIASTRQPKALRRILSALLTDMQRQVLSTRFQTPPRRAIVAGPFRTAAMLNREKREYARLSAQLSNLGPTTGGHVRC
jgi:hypothetical protein